MEQPIGGYHRPVLLEETLAALDVRPDGTYLDGTAGSVCDIVGNQFEQDYGYRIVDGELDQVPEAAFYNVGSIDEVLQKAKETAE